MRCLKGMTKRGKGSVDRARFDIGDDPVFTSGLFSDSSVRSSSSDFPADEPAVKESGNEFSILVIQGNCKLVGPELDSKFGEQVNASISFDSIFRFNCNKWNLFFPLGREFSPSNF